MGTTAARDLSLETLRLEQDGRVLTARYWSPPRNFPTTASIRDLDRLTSAVDRDATVGAVVLIGGVEGRFLTQADPRELGGLQSLPHRQLPMLASCGDRLDASDLACPAGVPPAPGTPRRHAFLRSPAVGERHAVRSLETKGVNA
jgi:hypothetical protein